MFFYTTGDLLQSDAEALVNTVNCEGYMGKGIIKTTLKHVKVAFFALESFIFIEKPEKSLSIFRQRTNGEKSRKSNISKTD